MSVLGKLTGLAVFAGIVAYWYFVVGGFLQDAFSATTAGHVAVYAMSFSIFTLLGLLYITPVAAMFALDLQIND